MLIKMTGATRVGTSQGPLQLAANGHAAQFADQLISGLPAGFTGVLDISSLTPFAALTIRSLINEVGNFLMTTFPIADQNRTAPSPIVFPQVADGGGYVTEFILISAGQAASTTLSRRFRVVLLPHRDHAVRFQCSGSDRIAPGPFAATASPPGESERQREKQS